MSHTHTPKWHMCALWMTQLAISSSIEQWNTAKILLPTGQWQTSIQPFSIHLTTSLHSGVKRVGDAYPSWLSSSPRGHTGRQTTTCTHSLWEFRVPSSPLEHVFGPWEEDGVPPTQTEGQRARTQRPHDRGSNPQPSRWEATALITAPSLYNYR